MSQELKQLLTEAGEPWQAGDPVFSDEQLEAMCGFRPQEGQLSLQEREATAQLLFENKEHFLNAQLASSVDLTSYMNKIRYQGDCGSCVAFGTVAAAEGTLKYQAKNPNLNVALSEAHLFYCHAYSEGRTCNEPLIPHSMGWWPDRALIALQQKGVVSAKCFPYDPANVPLPCKLCSDWASSLTYSTNYKKLTSVIAMKESLASNGPLIACLTVYEDLGSYKSGVYQHISGKDKGGHCVCIVGYDDAQQCWIGRNSWDTGWGMQGYFKIKYGQCGIDSEMWAIYMN